MVAGKIRVLNVYNIMDKGGAETFVFNVYKNIDKKRFQFDFLCQSRKKGVFDDDLRKMGANIYHFKRFNSKNPIKVIRDTTNFIRKHGPYDAIYLPMQFYSSVYCLAAKLAGIKNIVVHSHSAGDGKQKNRFRTIYQRLSRIIINKISNKKIACGQKAGEFLFGKKAKFKIIHNGVDLNRFYPANEKELRAIRKRFEIEEDALIVGNVGRFVRLKNHEFFLEIAKKLKDDGISHKIVLVGDGELKNEFKKKIRNNNLQDSFMMVDSVDDPSDYFRLFDIFVLPSLYEGFPTVVVEALACGVPCLLSNTITNEISSFGDVVAFENLDLPASRWIDEMLRLKQLKIDKSEVVSILKAKGYCIMDVAKEASKLYES